VLLDLDLPETNGIEVVRHYGVEDFPLTIFLATHERFAAEAFQVNAFDYIVKPLTEERLHAAFDRVVGVLHSDRSPSAILRDGTRIPMSRSQKLRVFEHVGDDPGASTS